MKICLVPILIVIFLGFVFLANGKTVSACEAMQTGGCKMWQQMMPGSSFFPDSPKCSIAQFDCCTVGKVKGNNPMSCGIWDVADFPLDGISDPKQPVCFQHMNILAAGEETWCFINKTIPTNTPYPTPLPVNVNCANSSDINTQIGCIPADNPNDTAAWIFKRVFLIVSAIALFLMVSGGIAIATSAGNPDKVKHGRENITAALTGLIFIILAIFLLRLIGVDIIKIPGFAK